MRISLYALLAVIRFLLGDERLKAIDDLELCLRCNLSQKQQERILVYIR